jgi:transposase
MSYYNRGPDRTEIQLLPACLDDYIQPNCPARFIDAYVETLDFGALGFKHAQPAGAGRPPYHPADLLKLYIYGYLHRIRSSRRLEAEAARNLELIWLLRSIRPDFKTIADFRKDNCEAFKKLFKQFNLLCRKLDLFGAELVAIDGAKFKAVNNSRRYYTEGQLQELIKKIESRVEEYLGDMDRQDGETEGVPAGPGRQELEQKVALLKERKAECQQVLDELESSGQSGAALTDPDAGKMKGAQGFVIGYNVQVAVDAKHDLIVAQEVVQAATDVNQLAGMAVAAKEQLGVQKLQALADKGYYEADQLESCEKAAVETFVPEPGGSGGMGKGGKSIFPKEQFVYDAAKDTYCCPAGQTLELLRQDTNHGKKRLIYLNRQACKECALRRQCTTGTYRVIARRINEAVMERAAARAAARADLVAARKEIVEHVFGTLRNWTHDTFLLRGLAKVRAEFSLSALVYNLRRVLNVVSMEQLLKSIGFAARNG